MSGGGLDVAQARVAFRDRTLSDVLDLALRFIVVHGKTYAKVALVTLVPCTLISVVAGMWLGWKLAWAIAVPLAIFAEAPFTVLASRLVFEDDVRARDVLRTTWREAPRLAFTRVLTAMFLALGFSACLIPGFWLATVFLFLTEVMLLERATLGQAFSRASHVAQAAPSEVMMGILVFALLPVGSVLLADVAGQALIHEVLQFEPPATIWKAGGSALATLGLFVQVAYLATARFFLYLNVRTRVEGWDIQTRFAALAARKDEAA